VAHQRDCRITQALTSLLPKRRIRDLARRCGAVQRQRKVDIVAFVYSLVLGFAAGDRRTLTGLRRAYTKTTGVPLAPSSFYDRFTEGLSTLMQTLMLEALDKLAPPRAKLGSVFRRFREVLVADSTLIRLHNALEAHYPSVWRHYMRASIKLTVVMNVLGRGAKTVGLTHGSHHDVHLLQVGPWVKKRLLIFDLGFFRAVLFKAIARHGGYFLCRLRLKSNPVIIASHRRGQRHLVGRKLREVLNEIDDDTVDIEGEMGYLLRGRVITNHKVRFRVVALYNHELGTWHCYVTNLPTSMLEAKHIWATYAARWEVELMFRELKSKYRLNHTRSKSRHVTECLVYAALLTLVLSRKLYQVLLSRWRADRRRFPFDRWATLVASIAVDLLDLLISRHDRRLRERKLDTFLRTEALDPNAHRLTLATRAEMGHYGRA
jgi:putative transposase